MKIMQIKLKFEPIIRMLGVIAIVTLVIVFIHAELMSLPNFKILMEESSWIFADLVHLPQFLIPFLLICYITKGNLGEYGFNLKEDPPLFTHRRMLMIGISTGLIMSLKYIVQIIGNSPLDIPRPVTPTNILGYMIFQWIIVGVSEETMFRGLIQTYLMKNLEGSVDIANHEFHVGTVVGAIFWGGFHFINILNMPLQAAFFTVLLTTPIGLLIGYAYQRTESLLTTIIVHNSIFGVPLLIGYILYFLR